MAKSPEATYRLSNISASIFVQETGEGQQKRKFRTINLQRSYRDGDETKFVSNFTMSDLPAAIRCLQLAQAHVESKEAEVAA
ncbi:MAG: hypothetical protein AAGB04_00735 [Pseudomonadota bacterium]